MASVVHFKFKSQKDPQRVAFDGSTISVWDLKREIITLSKLGDGTDFELKIYDENTNEEYDDDLAQIPKNSSVLARRLPAAVPGKGRAARYISGKAPINARTTSAKGANTNSKVIDMDSAQTEEERVKAMFSLHSAQWQQKQEEMAQDTKMPMIGMKAFQRKSNVPEGEPPHGYICYRCGKKGHWIQACPTNDDPNYENKNRIKRTTGIPRSMLKKIDEADIDNLDESERQHLMVNAEGEYVSVQADEREWRKHQERVKAAVEASKNQVSGDKDLQARGLECPIDKRMFLDPMKTPCCGKTYCHDCIENALLENDLTCPACQKGNVSLEGLEPDEEAKAKIKEYEREKADVKASSPESPSARPRNNEPQSEPQSREPTGASREESQNESQSTGDRKESQSPGSRSPTPSNAGVRPKKRSASQLEGEATGPVATGLAAPTMKRQKSGERSESAETVETIERTSTPANDVNAAPGLNAIMPEFTQMMQSMQNMQSLPNMSNMPNMPFPVAMPLPGMPFVPMAGMMPNFMPPNFNMMNGMNMNGMNGMNMNGMGGMNMNGIGMFPQNSNFMNGSVNPMMNGNPFNQQNAFQNKTSPPQQPKGMTGVPTGPRNQNYPSTGSANHKFSNQQRHTGKEEDNAYMRQPVNPHRHQNRQRRARQADYREV